MSEKEKEKSVQKTHLWCKSESKLHHVVITAVIDGYWAICAWGI